MKNPVFGIFGKCQTGDGYFSDMKLHEKRCRKYGAGSTFLSMLTLAMATALVVPLSATASFFNVSSGDTSGLINAINAANANGKKDTIRLEPGVYTVSGIDNSADGLNGLPSITSVIKITGESAIINQDISADYRIFHVAETGRLTMNGISFQGLGSIERGTAVFNRGEVVIEDSLMSDNASLTYCLLANYGEFHIKNSSVTNNSSTSVGCSICNYATINIEESSIDNNFGDGCGAIENNGVMSIVSSSVSENRGTMAGGILNTGDLVIENSTISSNDVFNLASAIENSGGTVELVSTTIANNRSDFYGYGIGNQGGIILKNSLIADNSSDSGLIPMNCSGNPLQSDTHNLDSDATCGLNGQGDLSGVDPLLDELALNGGSTRNHALLPGSPAIDAGSRKGFIREDQRGVRRPRDGDGDGKARSDIGAFEL